MREKIAYLLLAGAGILLAINLYQMFMVLPDEAAQGPIYRIMFFHVPSAITGMVGFLVAMCASVAYIATGSLRWDGIAVAVTDVSMPFATIVLVTGSIWARIIWGIWWTWDARLTSMLICWLLYAGYLMLRRAIEDPTQRARLSAVLSIFAFANVIIVWKSIDWWRTQHPGPVLSIRGAGGRMDPAMESTLYWNLLALALLAAAIVLVRVRQEGMRRELDALRRLAHSM